MPPTQANLERETTAHPVAMAVRMFTAQATSLVDTFDNLINPLSENLFGAVEDFESMIKEHRPSQDDLQDQSPHPMPLIKQTAYILHKQRLDDAKFAFDILPRALLLSLVAIYDHFLRNHIEAIYTVRSELRNTIQTGFTIPELIKFNKLEDAIEDGMEHHLDNVMRTSHLSQLEWLENLLKMKLTVEVPALPRFVELTERRNMIAHCGGVATRFYVEQCTKYGVNPGAAVGHPLSVDKAYFTDCYNCVFEIGVKLSQSTWRKIQPEDIALADHVLRGITYALLVIERFELARNLLEFANDLKRHSSDHFSRIFTVNLAQCYKWLGNMDRCYEILAKKDWTATEPSFLLAERVLYEDYTQAKQLMILTGRDKYIPEEAFRDWPLFREFRRSKEFGEAYEELYGREFIKDA
jgi:hypothetical protein